MGVSAEQCIEAFRRFVVQHRVVSALAGVPQAHHVCCGACHWFEHHNVFICRKSGNIHFCGEDCDKLVETHEHNVCALTGRTYNLELRYENAVNWKRDALNRTTVPETEKTPRVRIAKTVNDNNYSRGSDWANTVQRLSVDAHNFVNNLMQSVQLKDGATLATLVDTTYVTKYILSLWTQISNTELYKRTYSHKYKFLYHCAVIVYSMRDGVEVPVGNPIVPVHPAIKQHIPPVKKLSPHLKIEQSAFTANGKLFQKFLAHIYQPSPCLDGCQANPESTRSRSRS